MDQYKWPQGIPTPDEFRGLCELVSYSSVAAALSGADRREKIRGLLSDFTPYSSSVFRQRALDALDGFWIRVVEHSVFRWLEPNAHFRQLWKSFDRKAKSKASTRFTEPTARFYLLDCIAGSLETFYVCKVGGYTPRQPSLATKEKTLGAIQVIFGCEKQGLRIWELTGDFGLSERLKQLAQKIDISMKQHKKGPPDSFVLHRYVTRSFAEKLIQKFGTAPPVLVKYFAPMIGYSAENVDKNMPEWLKLISNQRGTSNALLSELTSPTINP